MNEDPEAAEHFRTMGPGENTQVIRTSEDGWSIVEILTKAGAATCDEAADICMSPQFATLRGRGGHIYTLVDEDGKVRVVYHTDANGGLVRAIGPENTSVNEDTEAAEHFRTMGPGAE